MHAPTIRNNPFVVFTMFIVIGVVFARAIDMSAPNTVLTVALFSLAGFIAIISDVQDQRTTTWTRKLDTVLTMERVAAPAIAHVEDVLLRTLPTNVWYGHATNLANKFSHFREADGTCVVIAYIGDEPIGMFSSANENWLVMGQGELV